MKTKLITACAICATLIMPLTRGNNLPRVVEIVHHQEQFPFTIDPETGGVDMYPVLAESVRLAFTCSLGGTYRIWATENMDSALRYVVRDVTAGDEDAPIQVNSSGENVVTVAMPKLFLPSFTNGRGFLQISIAESEPEPTPDQQLQAVGEAKVWRLVCIGSPLALSPVETVAQIATEPAGKLKMAVNYTGPNIGDSSMVGMSLKTWGQATAFKETIDIPDQNGAVAGQPNTNEVVVSLDRYDGQTVPRVIFTPAKNDWTKKSGELQFHMRTRGGDIGAAATFAQKVGLVVFTIREGGDIITRTNVPPGSDPQVVTGFGWRFAPMDGAQFIEFKKGLKKPKAE